jgi:threonine dehydratase
MNPIRSFKGRGADFFFTSQRDPKRPLICASAGNFGQALAFAARKRGRTIEVFAAENANPLKVERMRALGAQVSLAGADFDAAKDLARERAQESGALFVEDGREPAISEGAGTVGVELSTWPRPLDSVLVPLGNGALLVGIATWFKRVSPGTAVVAVTPTGAPAMAESLRRGRVVATDATDTIADGLATRAPVPEALDVLRGKVDDILEVSDASMIAAMRLAHRELGLVLEPAGAAGLAAAMDHRLKFAGQRVATILCGGNLTLEGMARWLS